MRKFFRGIFILAIIPVAGVYILASLTPYISPASFWPMTFLGLGFPIIAVAFLAVACVSFMLNKKLGVTLLILFVLVGFKNLSASVAVHFFSKTDNKKDPTTLRVIGWNCSYFQNNSKHAESPDSARRKMINYLIKANADVVLLQEFIEYTSKTIYSNIEVLRDTLGYKYYYFTRDVSQTYSYGKAENGVIIFSKHPIVDSGKVSFKKMNVNESMGYADIVFRGRKARIYTTHLVSMSLFNKEQRRAEGRFINYDKAVVVGKTKYRPLRYYDSIHAKQAELVRQVLSTSPYPVIFSGDINSVPTSYVYHKIRGNLNDAFVEKGKWLGTSYEALSPTLRIDYIFLDPQFKVNQFQTPKVYLSDHFPVIADIEWAHKK